jgi:hypothetical protein
MASSAMTLSDRRKYFGIHPPLENDFSVTEKIYLRGRGGVQKIEEPNRPDCFKELDQSTRYRLTIVTPSLLGSRRNFLTLDLADSGRAIAIDHPSRRGPSAPRAFQRELSGGHFDTRLMSRDSTGQLAENHPYRLSHVF